jgi:hypothetical protein
MYKISKIKSNKKSFCDYFIASHDTAWNRAEFKHIHLKIKNYILIII